MSYFLRIPFPLVPREIADRLTAISQFLTTMENYETHFSYAVDLLEFIRSIEHEIMAQKPPLPNTQEELSARFEWANRVRRNACWLHAAAREGVMQAHNFWRTVESFQSYPRNGLPGSDSPDVRAYMRKANALHEQYFSDVVGARTNSAHEAEMTRPNWVEKHAVRGEIDTDFLKASGDVHIQIGAGLSGTVFYGSYEGRVVSLDVSQDTTDKLRQVRCAYAEILGPIQAAIDGLNKGLGDGG